MARRRRDSHYPLFDGPAASPGGAGAGLAVEPFIVATAPLPAAALAQLQQGARIAAAILWTCQHPERFPGLGAPKGE